MDFYIFGQDALSPKKAKFMIQTKKNIIFGEKVIRHNYKTIFFLKRDSIKGVTITLL